MCIADLEIRFLNIITVVLSSWQLLKYKTKFEEFCEHKLEFILLYNA